MSDFGKFADTIMNLGKDDGIKCRPIDNASCLKCDKVNKSMVRIGAFIMCEFCWMSEFGVNVISIESELYTETYSKWLKIYQNK